MQTTANLWEVLCRDLESQRQHATAEQYRDIARDFLASARQMLRSNSPRLCDAIEIAGDVCQAAGQMGEAALDFEEALRKSREFGVTQSSARLAAKLALVLDYLGELQRAREVYNESVDAYDQLHDHSQHSMLLNQLGALCKRQGDLVAAEQAYFRAMEVATRLHGPNHPEVGIAANNLAVAYGEAREFVKAENLHMQALSIREKCYGAMHPDVAQSMANLAVVYHATKNFDKARVYYENALQIYRRFRKADDEEIQVVKANYEALLEKIQGK